MFDELQKRRLNMVGSRTLMIIVVELLSVVHLSQLSTEYFVLRVQLSLKVLHLFWNSISAKFTVKK